MGLASLSDPSPTPRWSASGWAIVGLGFLVGFALFPLRLVGLGFEYQPGDLVDGRLNQYVLEHGYRFLNGSEPRFWDLPIWYPVPHITAYSDSHLGTLPLYATLRACGLSQEAAYQVWFLTLFALNYAGWIWAARRIGLRAFGTAIGGYFFTFGLPITVVVTQHSQFGPRFLAPAGLVLAWEFLWRPATPRFARFAICVAAQMYLTIYVGYFLVIVAVLQSVIVGVWFRRELPWNAILRPGRDVWRNRGIALAVSVVLLAPLAGPYLVAGTEHPYCDFGTIQAFSPLPSSWVNSSVIGWHHDWTEPRLPQRHEFGFSEKQLFPGFLPIFAVGFVLYSLRRNRPQPGSRAAFVSVAAITTVATMILVTRIGGWSLYDPMFLLPGGNGIRVSGRIMLVVWSLVAVAIAETADIWVDRAKRFGARASALTGVGLVAVLLADQWIVWPSGSRATDWKYVRVAVADVVERRERMKAVIAKRPRATLVYAFPNLHHSDFASIALQLDVMTACQELDVPTINGWSGYPPNSWWKFTALNEVLTWVCHEHQVSDELLAGIVFIGEPSEEEPSAQWKWILWQHRFRAAPRLLDTGR